MTKMTIREVTELHGAIQNLPRDISGVKFGYAVGVNRRRIKDVIESLVDAARPSDAELKNEKELDEKKRKLHELYSPGTDEWKTKVAEIEELEKIEKTFEGEKEKREKEYQEKLKEFTEVDLYMLKLSDVPEKLPAAFVVALNAMLTDESLDAKTTK